MRERLRFFRLNDERKLAQILSLLHHAAEKSLRGFEAHTLREKSLEISAISPVDFSA